jgi:aminoglycoside phosphotransferase (APT) family kinase protein
VTITAPPVQIRTWNLSSIWKIPTDQGLVWLKHVPPFFAHESSMLRALGDDARVPRLIAGEPGRMLLADVPGDDCYEADGEQLEAMLDTLISLQVEWIGREDELLALGAPDWRRASYVELAADVVARGAPSDDRSVLDAFVARLPSIFDHLDACGVPDTFVHGDFHPGNVRWSQGCPVILDWGDVGVGHPLLDLPAFIERVGDRAETLHARWMRRWAAAVPGSEPARAAELIAPVALMRQAIIYQRFLDGIEESERVYHRADVPERLASVAAMIV